jgi:hypothetical protein
MAIEDYYRVNELLNELGVLMVKQKCAALFNQGLTREEVNDVLNERLIPELNSWRESILQGFKDESIAGQTLN